MAFENSPPAYVTSDIAIFGVHPKDGNLAVVLQKSDHGLSLPNTLIDDYLSRIQVATHAAETVGLGKRTILPFVEQTGSVVKHGPPVRLHVGHIAITTLREGLTLADPTNLDTEAVTETAQEIIANSLKWLRDLSNFSIEGIASDKTRTTTRKILARLVDDPRSFTLSELQPGCEAILGRTYNPGNFWRSARHHIGVSGTGKYKDNYGRPQLYRMPRSTLDTSDMFRV